MKWIAPVLLLNILVFYVLNNSFTFAAAFRYAVDMGFNVGMGDGNLNEDELSLFVTTVWMLVGYFIVFNWWFVIIQTIMGNTVDNSLGTVAQTGHNKVKWFSELTGLSPAALSGVVTTVWGVNGVIFGVVVEEWSILKSVNFAVGGMTTTGSQLVSNTALSNTLGGIYMLIGVPLLSITLSLATVEIVGDKKVVETTIQEKLEF